MKRSVLIFSICLLLVGVFVLTYNVELVGADSGFDSSYDSGYDSGGYGDSDGDLGSIIYLIYLCIEYPPIGIGVLIVGTIIYLSNKKQKKKELNDILNNALNNNKLELLDVNNYREEKRLEIEAFNIYKQIQYAWMNFDEETLRKLTTDEMYNMYLMQMDTLKVKNQKNIMYDINYSYSYIKHQYEKNGQETIVINMQVTCYDFIIDTTNNSIVRGNANKKMYNYELTFVKTSDNKSLDICPRCGAPVEANNSGVCEYCKSTLISNNYTLILSKKEMINQK